MMYRAFLVIGLVLCAVVPRQAHAEVCSLEEGYSAESLLQSKEEAELAQATLRQLKAFEKFIGSRKWEDGKPMSQQMSAEEASEFGKYQKQQEIAVTKQLFESRRERDIQVIRKLAILADKISRYGLEDSVSTDPKSDEMLLASVLFATRELLDVNLRELGEEGGKPCNLATALEDQARDAVVEFSEIENFSEVMTESKRLAKIYETPIDEKKMTATDRETFLSEVKPKLRKAQAIMERSKDLYRLALIERTSKKMLAALRQDQYESPGDQAYMGTTWDRWRKEGRVSEREHQLTGVVNFINTKIPAPIISDWEEIARKK